MWWAQHGGAVPPGKHFAATAPPPRPFSLKGFAAPGAFAAQLFLTMKLQSLLAVVLSLGALAASSVFAATPIPGYTPLKITRADNPMYPQQALTSRTGEVRLALNVDDQGQLKDVLVLGYTRKPFADAAVAAVKDWRFQPAQLNGQPVGAVAEFTFHFETTGAVISLTAVEVMEEIFNNIRGNDTYTYGLTSVRDLDRTPVTATTTTPVYPVSLSRAGAVGKVNVDFYIDDTGAVRMPAVTLADDLRLADLAVDALRQWKFTVPTRRGEPVPVRVSQTFTFLASAEPAPKASR